MDEEIEEQAAKAREEAAKLMARRVWIFARLGMVGAAAAWATMPVAVPPMWCGFAVDWLCFFYFDWLLKSLVLLTLLRWVQKPLRRFITLQAAGWSTVFLVMRLLIFLPFFLPLLPLFPTPNEIADAALFRATNEGHATWNLNPNPPAPLLPPEQVAVSAAFTSPLAPAALCQTALFWFGFSLAAAFSLVWLVKAVYEGFLLSRSLRDARRMIGEATPLSHIQGAEAAALRQQGDKAADILNYRRPFEIRLARPGAILGPMTFGWRRPVIALMHDALTWSETRQYATLLHEVAHIQRGDWPQCIATNLVSVLFWFAPAVQNANDERRMTADMCCDAALARTPLDSIEYAHILEETIAEKKRLQRQQGSGRRARMSVLVGMVDFATKKEAKKRVDFILNEVRQQRSLWRWVSPVVGATLFLPLLLLLMYTLTPSGAVTSQPLLIPVTRRDNGDLYARRAEYWKGGNWADASVCARPSGEMSTVIHLTKSQLFFGCSIGATVFLLDKERRVLFKGGPGPRGMDGRFVDVDTIADTMLTMFDDRVPPDIVRRTAYIAILYRENWRSFAWRRLQERIPALRTPRHTAAQAWLRSREKEDREKEAQEKKTTATERWAESWLNWLTSD